MIPAQRPIGPAPVVIVPAEHVFAPVFEETVEDDAGTSASEQEALAFDQEPMLPAEQSPAPAAAPRGLFEDEPRTAAWMRPLQWINAPLAGCSDRTRDFLGAVAIVATLNAIAILVYLLYWR